jgi:hypothetical protein
VANSECPTDAAGVGEECESYVVHVDVQDADAGLCHDPRRPVRFSSKIRGEENISKKLATLNIYPVREYDASANRNVSVTNGHGRLALFVAVLSPEAAVVRVINFLDPGLKKSG